MDAAFWPVVGVVATLFLAVFGYVFTLSRSIADNTTTAGRQGDRWVLATEIENPSKTPALLVRLKVVREKSGDRILPALYEDNYFTLLPGETRRLRTELEQADTRGERPSIVVEGFNVQAIPPAPGDTRPH